MEREYRGATGPTGNSSNTPGPSGAGRIERRPCECTGPVLDHSGRGLPATVTPEEEAVLVRFRCWNTLELYHIHYYRVDLEHNPRVMCQRAVTCSEAENYQRYPGMPGIW